VLGDDHFPLSDIPFQAMVEKAAAGRFSAKPSRVLGFEEIVDAHRLIDAGEAGGKLVVTV